MLKFRARRYLEPHSEITDLDELIEPLVRELELYLLQAVGRVGSATRLLAPSRCAAQSQL